jgi:riboflavin kinase/FMN adenylyltransferase
MRVIRGLENLQPLAQPTVVSVGVFDGVHAGHQMLLAHVTREAQRRGALASVVTFEPYPAEVLSPQTAPARLTTLEEKLEFIAKLQVGLCVVLDFTLDFARTPHEQFVREVLVGGLRAEHVVAGATHTFGAGGAGDPSRLAELGRQHGFTVESVEPALVEGRRGHALGRRPAGAGLLDAGGGHARSRRGQEAWFPDGQPPR